MLAVLIVVLAIPCVWVWARPPAIAPSRSAIPVLEVDTRLPGNTFAPGAVGLSTEDSELGSGRLRAGDYRLVRLMRLLGPAVLRIGGGSVDFSWWSGSGEPSPSWATSTVTPADLAALRGLLVATGWRVLLGVDLGHFEPTRAVDEARHAREILGAHLLGIEIGNEPNDYREQNRKVPLRSSTYNINEYLREAEAYRQALGAAVPGVAIYGPATSGGARWLTAMGGAASMFTALTQHYYPAACSLPIPAVPGPTVPDLLSAELRQHEDVTLATLAQARNLTGRPLRIGETGSGPCNGNSSASPAFASALWALDWSLRAASSGVQGLNFHGHFGLCGAYTQSPICAPNAKAASMKVLAPQPEYYGLLAASRLEGGRFVPTGIASPTPLANLTTRATLASSGVIRIAVINFATAGPAQQLAIHVPGYTATEQPLAGPSAEARRGIALGSAPVAGNGQWHPRAARLPRYGRGAFRIAVNPADAVIVTLRPHRHKH